MSRQEGVMWRVLVGENFRGKLVMLMCHKSMGLKVDLVKDIRSK